ncbi:AAA family ATPase [Gynurincola endophyticus]|uniref:AAA family ATPase n=1 Tax=Gynurincola endophyticus TaxID=2479004 RepID=UPI000F8EE714|nr:ATP-binding protein [Gynurincola endophyticus]
MKKIVVIGPESTGKSTLCEALAKHYGCLWVPEYARTFLEENGADYQYDDLKKIAEGQIHLENKYTTIAIENKHPYLFIDTNLYVIQVWSEYVFGNCDESVFRMHNQQQYDLYLLCNIDLPWQEDPLRELPDIEARKVVYNYYKTILQFQQVPWIEISGDSEQRLLNAVNGLEAIL